MVGPVQHIQPALVARVRVVQFEHGFHNNSTPRYQEVAAKLAWERTIAFFGKSLA